MVSKSLSTSRKFASLADEFAQVLYVLVVAHCDDFGRQSGDSFTVKHQVFPTSPRAEAEFESALVAMEANSLIHRYTVDDIHVLQVSGFDGHQVGLHKRSGSRFPEPPGDSRNLREFPGDSLLIEQKGTELKGTEQNGTVPAAARQPAQGSGALPTNSLPRYHMKHAVCGPNFRICLLPWQRDDLAAKWGGDLSEGMKAAETFVASLEVKVGDGPLGDWQWLREHFSAWMGQQGRAPVAALKTPVKPPMRPMAEILADDAKRKAVRKAQA